MGLSGNQKAIMYALGGLARGGATRGGYHSGMPYVSIGGATGARVLVSDLSVHDLLDEVPNTCQFTVMGGTGGGDVVITLGSINSGTRLFAGTIISSVQGYLADKPAQQYTQCNGIDYTWRLSAHIVERQYTSQTVAFIAQNLIASFAEGITALHIAADVGGIVVDTISFTNAALADALSQLCSRVGAYWNIDYFKDLHLFTQEPTTIYPDPTPLTPAHPSLANVTVQRDLSQIVTRVFVEGGGVTALAPVAPGDLMIPVETAAWYNPTGGVVVSGPQRITYQSAQPGGGGGLVGPGTSPSAAPTVAPTAGSGVTPGTHGYAYTDLTPSGESLPSPVASVSVGGVVAPPTVVPAVTGMGCANAGVAGLDLGQHDYVYTFVNASGETLPNVADGRAAVAYKIADPPVQPTITTSSGGGGTGDVISPNTYYEWKYSYSTSATSETNVSAPAGFTTGDIVDIQNPHPMYPLLQIPYSTDPNVFKINLYRSPPGGGAAGPFRRLARFDQNNASGGYAYLADGAGDVAVSNGVVAPTANQALVNIAVVNNIATSPDGSVTARKLYRRFNGLGTWRLCYTLTNNANTSTTDSVPNASLGANVPASNTAISAAVNVGGIAPGAAPTTGRKLYRTAANASQLKLLHTFAGDNTTTTFADTTPDASLGANAPLGDTSAMTQPNGQILAGSPTLLVASAVGASASGGWVATGSQVIRYGGVTGNLLTGIPPTGPGAITATISYNATVTFLPALVGIPASGAGAILYAINSGDDVNLLVTVDDTNAQTALAQLLGGSGILEGYIQDRRISAKEAVARGLAMLVERSSVLVEVRYTCRDPLTRSGATIVCNLPAPTNLSGSFKIQDVTINAFLGVPGRAPTYTVLASSQRYSLDDLLRQARGTIGA